MLIVGLGNIGKEYENTYHNVGFMLADKLAKKVGAAFSEKKCRAECAVFYKSGKKCVIAKPTTYMNLSGESVRELMGAYGFSAAETLVIFDDLDLPLGAVRIRKAGSGGTHNGMRNIIACIGTQEILRLRLGIGKPQNENMQIKDFVLSKIKGENLATLENTMVNLCEGLEQLLLERDIDKFMQNYNLTNANI